MKLSYFDRIDEHDNLIGGTASWHDVRDQGLWHRGVHVIIYTPDKQIVMQKRSPNLYYHPAEIEISVGGGVDAGESPDQAAVREAHEELGLQLDLSALRFIGKTKYNHRVKHINDRVIMYSYAICVPKESLNMKIDSEETTAVFLISARNLRRALKVHRIKHFGRISGQYAYWKLLLDSI